MTNGRNGNGRSTTRRVGRKNLRGKQARRGFPRLLAALAVVGIIGFVGMLVALVAAYLYYQRYADELVAPDELAINQPSYGAKIYDRNGKLLYEYVDDRSGLRRPIQLENVSEAFLAATIATEDDSFFTNPGINWKGLARAAWENLPLSGKPGLFEGSGGSSITQQLVKNVYIGQEATLDIATLDKEIADLKAEIAKLQGQTGIVRPFDSVAEIEALRRELENAELQRPSPAVSSHLDRVRSLQSKQQQRDERFDEILESRQTRSVDRKLKEVIYAIELTNRYSKEQILEWYVNQISYGGVYNGIEAAARGYFNKPAKDLTLAEAALLAGIPQSPATYDPVNNPEAAKARRDQILDLMHRQGRIQIGENHFFELDAETLAAARAVEIDIQEKRFPIEAPHFVLQYVEPQLVHLFGRDALFRDGLVVTTTLDLDAQNEAKNWLERWIREFENISNSHNGATIIIDPRTGEILTMLGSRDYFREDIEGKNNNVTALNSPGSSFKPFVYMSSFMKLGWGPGTYILDTPVSYKQIDGTEFVPTNPGKNFKGLITLRSALGNSLNIPANKVADATGIDFVVQTAKKMGITTLTGTYGPAIATGGVDLTVIDMAYGYTVFANGGIMRGQIPFVKHRAGERNLDPIAILKVEDGQKRARFDVNQRRGEERIIKEEYAYLVTSILTDGSAQCITFGCGGITVPGRQVAVKTGTSEPFDPKGPNAGKIGDTWAFGYSPDVVVGIWAGNSDNSPIVNIFSTSISFRAMRDTLTAWYAGRPGTAFRRPETVVDETVCVPSGLKPTPLCGKTTRDIFAKDSVPQTDDTWWQRVRIDGRTGLPATPTTPFQFVQEQVMLVLPKEMLQTEDDKKRAQEWADALAISLAPTEFSPVAEGRPLGPPTAARGGGGNVAISSPSGGSVSGVVAITGSASSANMQYYRLEFSLGGGGWSSIGQWSSPVNGGALASWSTSGLAKGQYALRLTVMDSVQGALVATVNVTVN